MITFSLMSRIEESERGGAEEMKSAADRWDTIRSGYVKNRRASDRLDTELTRFVTVKRQQLSHNMRNKSQRHEMLDLKM